ncbi:hypothetical protein ES703_117848 [subsurface metagenome]
MSTIDVSSMDLASELGPIPKKIVGNIILIAPNDYLIQKKLNRIESEYKEQIISF